MIKVASDLIGDGQSAHYAFNMHQEQEVSTARLDKAGTYLWPVFDGASRCMGRRSEWRGINPDFYS